MYGAQQPASGQLDITTSFNPMQFLLHGRMATIEIDDSPTTRPWGRWVFDLWPGQHILRVWFPYLFGERSGLAAMPISIWAGHVTMIRYETPLFITGGTMQIVGTRPMGAW